MNVTRQKWFLGVGGSQLNLNGQDIICMSIDENNPVLLPVIYNLQSCKITLIESDNQEVSFTI